MFGLDDMMVETVPRHIGIKGDMGFLSYSGRTWTCLDRMFEVLQHLGIVLISDELQHIGIP